MIKDSLGVPQEPQEEPHEYIFDDWLGEMVFSDDGDTYVQFPGDDEWVLWDEYTIMAYLRKYGEIKDTYQIYEEMKQNDELI